MGYAEKVKGLLSAGIVTALVIFVATLMCGIGTTSIFAAFLVIVPIAFLLVSPMLTFRIRVSLKQNTSVPVDFITVCSFAGVMGTLLGLCVLLPHLLSSGPAKLSDMLTISLFSSSAFVVAAFCFAVVADLILHFVIDRPLGNSLVPIWLQAGLILALILAALAGYMGVLEHGNTLVPMSWSFVWLLTAIMMLYPLAKYLGLWRVPALEKQQDDAAPWKIEEGAPESSVLQKAESDESRTKRLRPGAVGRKHLRILVFAVLWIAALLAFFWVSPFDLSVDLAFFIDLMLFFAVFIAFMFATMLYMSMRMGREIKWEWYLILAATLPFVLAGLYLPLEPFATRAIQSIFSPPFSDVSFMPYGPSYIIPMALAAMLDLLVFTVWKKPHLYAGMPRSALAVLGLHFVLLAAIALICAVVLAPGTQELGLGSSFAIGAVMFIVFQLKYLFPRELMG